MRIFRSLLIVFSIIAFCVFGISELIRFSERDTTKPQITAETDMVEVTGDYEREDLMEGIFAWDDREGDLTSQVVLSSFSRFIDEGVCELTYVVFDSSNQSASLTRKVRFSDYHPPRITLSAPLVFREGEANYSDVTGMLGAVDILGNDRKDWVSLQESTVNYQTEGEYTLSFEVSGSLGDSAEYTLPVHIISDDGLQPDILLNTGIAYVRKGSSFDAASYIAGVTTVSGRAIDPSAVSISTELDTEVPGCYQIHYQVSDSAGNSGENWLTVIVEEDEGGTE